MTKSIKNLCLFFLAIFILSSCEAPFTAKDNGRAIELQDESPFEIVLQGEEGMVWKLVEYNHQLIKLSDAEINEIGTGQSPKTQEYKFSFETFGSGQSVVKLIYVNKKDSADAPQKIYKIEIICGTFGRIESD